MTSNLTTGPLDIAASYKDFLINGKSLHLAKNGRNYTTVSNFQTLPHNIISRTKKKNRRGSLDYGRTIKMNNTEFHQEIKVLRQDNTAMKEQNRHILAVLNEIKALIQTQSHKKCDCEEGKPDSKNQSVLETVNLMYETEVAPTENDNFSDGRSEQEEDKVGAKRNEIKFKNVLNNRQQKHIESLHEKYHGNNEKVLIEFKKKFHKDIEKAVVIKTIKNYDSKNPRKMKKENSKMNNNEPKIPIKQKPNTLNKSKIGTSGTFVSKSGLDSIKEEDPTPMTKTKTMCENSDDNHTLQIPGNQNIAKSEERSVAICDECSKSSGVDSQCMWKKNMGLNSDGKSHIGVGSDQDMSFTSVKSEYK
ncbi:unnamed protein product [Moneuplotes crassus]|uniref:Uncharacterized protein n=1 Tax=Euplotes crassus TaxID=5936 RepID=A0AAD1U9G0_EUPCR|nr:unnamed protein product [Moneuplotes crassus]